MDKTCRRQLRRVFLIESLPEPLKPASRHLQIFDNYVENTRLRLRSVRSPETKEWGYILQQRIFDPSNPAELEIAEIHLDEAEHQAFEWFEGRQVKRNERLETNEIRKNRYFYEWRERRLEIDVFLGDLWGLNLAQAVFAAEDETDNFEAPPFAVVEVTGNLFFRGENLVGKTFADVRAEFARMNEAGSKSSP